MTAPHSENRIRSIEFVYYLCAATGIIFAAASSLRDNNQIMTHSYMNQFKMNTVLIEEHFARVSHKCGFDNNKDTPMRTIKDADFTYEKCILLRWYLDAFNEWRHWNDPNGDQADVYRLYKWKLHDYLNDKGTLRVTSCGLIAYLHPFWPDKTHECRITAAHLRLAQLGERIIEFNREDVGYSPSCKQIDEFLLQKMWWPHILLLAVAIRLGKVYIEWKGLKK